MQDCDWLNVSYGGIDVNQIYEEWNLNIQGHDQDEFPKMPQEPQRSSGGTEQPGAPLSTVAPKKKERIIGLGSIHDVPLAPSSYRSPAQMEAEIQELRTTQVEGAKTMAFYNSLFAVFSTSNHELHHRMQTYPNRPTQPGPSTINPEHATHNYFGDDIDFNLRDEHQDSDPV
ncbi:unnamed protein product [Cochlearia groenlandica]